MCKKMDEIERAMKVVCNQDDPTHKLIMLGASLTDTSISHLNNNFKQAQESTALLLSEINKEQLEIKDELLEALGRLTIKIDRHSETCPLGSDEKIKEIEADIKKQFEEIGSEIKKLDWLFTLLKYKPLTYLVGLGILVVIVFNLLTFQKLSNEKKVIYDEQQRVSKELKQTFKTSK